MKISLPFLLILLLFLFVGTLAQGLVSGQLLKSNGKPLPYTEIELVPLGSKRLINDSKLIGISDARGNFSLSSVPRGEYTLSINFDDKPTDLSPYETFFYPNTYNRREAAVFDIRDGVKLKKLIFKLPPALVKRKITGKVIFEDGKPVTGAYLALRDVKFDRSIFFGQYKTGKLGDFAFDAFGERKYQVAALLFERLGTTVYDPYEILGAAESEIFTLETAPPNLRLVLRQSQSYDEIRNKYMASLLPAYPFNFFKDLQGE
jgi:hypothetical protein